MVELADARDSRSLSTQFRARRDRLLRDFIERRRSGRAGTFRILDLGGTADYWRRVGFDWLEAQDVDVTCVNHIATEFGASEAEAKRLRCIVGDACDMVGHADNSWDLVHSNSVIEHVGRWPDMRRFASEVRRLAPAYYVQTPYFWFPVDPHFYRMPFYHWLPESMRLKAQRRFRLGWAPAQPEVDDGMRHVESNVLLDREQFRALFPDAEHRFERVAMLPKSMIALRGYS